MLLISENEVKSIFEKRKTVAIELVREAFIKRDRGEINLPPKVSQIFEEESQNRINCMSATLLKDNVSGVKWVSVFPENPMKGKRNVTGTIILSELQSGFTLSIMDGTYITGIRTAAVGAVAAEYLSKKDVEIIGFIGAGSEAKKHFEMIKTIRPEIKKCYVSSRREETVSKFVEEEKKYKDVEFINCGKDYKKAVINADIIVTATSTQKDLLKADWIKTGALYIHVGGWEDEYAVVNKANKIVCDEWENVKHRSQTLSRMYKSGLLLDNDIYANLSELITERKKGREKNTEFIYFNSVGLAYIDIIFAKYVYEECRKKGLGEEYKLSIGD